MRLLPLRGQLHKSFTGLLIALALVTLPLPALADDNPHPGQNTAASSNAQAVAPADNTTANPAPASVPDNTPALKLVPTSSTTPNPTLQAPKTEDNLSTNTPAVTSPKPSDVTGNSSPSATPITAAKVTNNVSSDATSGSATVKDNRKAGDAASGNADASATVINYVNSNGAPAHAFQTFECNVAQDTQDNLVIDPSSLLPICQSTNVGTTQPVASTGGIQTGASLTDILNNIALKAISGNVMVDGNRAAGNATSGEATAVANVLNIANTSISAQNSFLGIINIRSNLAGNILVPQSLVDGLGGNIHGSAFGGNATTNITNTIDASAISGNATVDSNRKAGNATSGEAMTSLTVLNLTGQEVVAKNSLLVFVNVLGKWTGMIVPAPGTRTALLGSSLQSGASSAASGNLASDTTTNITNTISVSAQSGDAAVTNNRKAGNATSGKASAGVNLLNITNSNFRLDDWFGALFINVFGSWIGSFDIKPTTSTAPNPTDGNASAIVREVQVYQLTSPATVKPVAASQRTAASTATQQEIKTTAVTISTASSPAGAVLGASTFKRPTGSNAASHTPKFDIIALGAIVSAITLLIAMGGLAIRHWHSA